MAKKVEIIYTDDIDGTSPAETVSFGLDGTSYEIDLSDENAAKLRDALALYIGHATKVPGGRRAAKKGASTSPKVIRDWARDAGYTVPDRGRVPASVREAFEAAH